MSGEFSAAPGFSTFEKQDNVLLALSGGVDSAVTAHILRQQGFSVQGLFILFSSAHEAALEKARQAAKELAIPFHVADAREAFERAVVQPFCQAYCAGRTPSPCVACNPLVKFRTLADTATRLGIPYLASGHYARVVQQGSAFHIARAQSAARDQSYMLYALGQDILSRLCLPLGEFEKEDIRAMAASYGLSSAEAPDSQEICFIPDGDYAAFIAARGLADTPGHFFGPAGEGLGPHRGVSHYTVGQRKGLGIAYGQPVFVRRILPNGDIQLATAGGEEYTGITVAQPFSASGTPFAAGQRFCCKVRSRAAAVPCTVVQAGGPLLTLRFDSPVRAPAPGQAAVFYDGDVVLGGGIIGDMLAQV